MTVENFPIPNLHLKSTIGELQLYEAQVSIDKSAQYIMDFFGSNSTIPGVIIVEHNTRPKLLSRKIFFEGISKPYGLELYFKRPIRVMVENLQNLSCLVLPHTTPIVTAVQQALQRSETEFTDPVVVEVVGGRLKIVDIHQLLQAHSHIHALALDKLREINQFKTELLGIASHDLKNPLNSIINIAKVVQEELEQHSFASEMIGQIYDTSQHMLNLVVELLNSSVIETGRMELKRKMFDMQEIVSAIVWQNKAQAENKQQHIAYNPDMESVFAVNGDGVKLRESMENLVSNALKYSPPGATIWVSLVRHNNNICFSVRDEGPGLSDDDKEKLFGKFQKLSAQPTAGESSTGLGLYITKQIIDLHGGAIRVESTHGNGATFTIEIPACDISALGSAA